MEASNLQQVLADDGPEPSSACGLHFCCRLKNLMLDNFKLSSTVVDGQVFLCGGAREGEQCSRHLWLFQPQQLQVFLPQNSHTGMKIQVHRLSSMRQGRNFPALAALNGKIFAMGGRAHDSTVDRLSSVEVYDVETNQWRMAKPLVSFSFTSLIMALFRSSRGLTQQEWCLEGRSMWWAALTELTSFALLRGSTQGLAGGRRWLLKAKEDMRGAVAGEEHEHNEIWRRCCCFGRTPLRCRRVGRHQEASHWRGAINKIHLVRKRLSRCTTQPPTVGRVFPR